MDPRLALPATLPIPHDDDRAAALVDCSGGRRVHFADPSGKEPAAWSER